MASLDFADAGIAIPMIINITLVVAVTRSIVWVRMSPNSRMHALDFGHFRDGGIETGGGHASAVAASTQLLILPLLLLAWGIAVRPLWKLL